MSKGEVSELLKPRFKVVSDWPGRKDFEVNQIVILDKDFSPQYKAYEVEDCQGKRQYITSFFEMFPLQFKRLDWSEERDISDLPPYIKSMDSKVYKVVKYRPSNGKAVARIIDDFWKTEVWQELGYPFWMPATETEWLEFNKKK